MNLSTLFKTKILLYLPIVIVTILSCYSNNCPMDNAVLCNYYFYDMNGIPITFEDTITVKTLRPGYKTLWTYRKMGFPTLTYEKQNANLVSQGYSESSLIVRKDTVLLNKVSGKAFIQVPMSYYFDADTLVFDYSSISASDTIRIAHESYPHVTIPECGTYRFHNIKSIECTDAFIDHIEISNEKVNYDGAENLKIFFIGEAR